MISRVLATTEPLVPTHPALALQIDWLATRIQLAQMGEKDPLLWVKTWDTGVYV
jgi:hypothetical protein